MRYHERMRHCASNVPQNCTPRRTRTKFLNTGILLLFRFLRSELLIWRGGISGYHLPCIRERKRRSNRSRAAAFFALQQRRIPRSATEIAGRFIHSVPVYPRYLRAAAGTEHVSPVPRKMKRNSLVRGDGTRHDPR